MKLLEKYEVDNDALVDGVWHEHEGSKFKLAHADSDLNPKYAAAIEEYRAEHLDDPNRQDLSPQQAKEAVRFGFEKAILTDWELENGKPFSLANVRELLKLCPLLYFVLLGKAREYDRYRKHRREQDLKN